MHCVFWLIAASGVLSPPLATRDTLPHAAGRGPVLPAAFASYTPPLWSPDSALPQRPKAVEFSNAYYIRLAIHRYASYATVPLFVTEYVLGQSLYNQTTPADTTRPSRSLRSWHGLAADGIAGLFVVNTVTGTWNLWQSRHVAPGRTRRYVHAALMLVSDAGFVATGMISPHHRELGGTGIDPHRRTLHRTVAIASMSTALIGDVMMFFWNKH
jgi:hypothetical protein